MNPDPRLFLPSHLFGEVRQITPITMGMSGAGVFDVATSTGNYVLRIHSGDRPSWDKGLAMVRLASERGLGPRLVHVDESGPAVVTVKIEGMNLGMAMRDPDLRQKVLGSVVARLVALHAIPIDGMEVNLDVVAMGLGVWEQQRHRPGIPAWVRPLGARHAEAAATLRADRRRVFSHNDLNPANMLWDGTQVWLVDWGGAGPAHPYLDLAGLSTFLMLPEEVALALLGAQERAPIDAGQREIFRAARDYARLTYGIVFLSLVPDLEATPIAGREETPALGELYTRVREGKVAFGTPEGQALFGAALLKG